MHKDIVRSIHEFEHSGYTVKIVERKMGSVPFPYFYVLDSQGNTCGGMNYYFFSSVSHEDLEDLSISVPKIKLCIDKMVASQLKRDEEIAQKKLDRNWTGQRFERGDFVHFKGNTDYEPYDTFVWAHFAHMRLEYYLIEHHQGQPSSKWMSKPPFQDGFEAVHSSQLKDGLLYIQINCHEEFRGETDELILLERKTQQS